MAPGRRSFPSMVDIVVRESASVDPQNGVFQQAPSSQANRGYDDHHLEERSADYVDQCLYRRAFESVTAPAGAPAGDCLIRSPRARFYLLEPSPKPGWYQGHDVCPVA